MVATFEFGETRGSRKIEQVSARGGPEDCLSAGEAVVAEAALAVCAGKRRSAGAWAELQQQMYHQSFATHYQRIRRKAGGSLRLHKIKFRKQWYAYYSFAGMFSGFRLVPPT